MSYLFKGLTASVFEFEKITYSANLKGKVTIMKGETTKKVIFFLKKGTDYKVNDIIIH